MMFQAYPRSPLSPWPKVFSPKVIVHDGQQGWREPVSGIGGSTLYPSEKSEKIICDDDEYGDIDDDDDDDADDADDSRTSPVLLDLSQARARHRDGSHDQAMAAATRDGNAHFFGAKCNIASGCKIQNRTNCACFSHQLRPSSQDGSMDSETFSAAQHHSHQGWPVPGTTRLAHEHIPHYHRTATPTSRSECTLHKTAVVKDNNIFCARPWLGSLQTHVPLTDPRILALSWCAPDTQRTVDHAPPTPVFGSIVPDVPHSVFTSAATQHPCTSNHQPGVHCSHCRPATKAHSAGLGCASVQGNRAGQITGISPPQVPSHSCASDPPLLDPFLCECVSPRNHASAWCCRIGDRDRSGVSISSVARCRERCSQWIPTEDERCTGFGEKPGVGCPKQEVNQPLVHYRGFWTVTKARPADPHALVSVVSDGGRLGPGFFLDRSDHSSDSTSHYNSYHTSYQSSDHSSDHSSYLTSDFSHQHSEHRGDPGDGDIPWTVHGHYKNRRYPQAPQTSHERPYTLQEQMCNTFSSYIHAQCDVDNEEPYDLSMKRHSNRTPEEETRSDSVFQNKVVVDDGGYGGAEEALMLDKTATLSNIQWAQSAPGHLHTDHNSRPDLEAHPEHSQTLECQGRLPHQVNAPGQHRPLTESWDSGLIGPLKPTVVHCESDYCLTDSHDAGTKLIDLEPASRNTSAGPRHLEQASKKTSATMHLSTPTNSSSRLGSPYPIESETDLPSPPSTTDSDTKRLVHSSFYRNAADSVCCGVNTEAISPFFLNFSSDATHSMSSTITTDEKYSQLSEINSQNGDLLQGRRGASSPRSTSGPDIKAPCLPPVRVVSPSNITNGVHPRTRTSRNNLSEDQNSPQPQEIVTLPETPRHGSAAADTQTNDVIITSSRSSQHVRAGHVGRKKRSRQRKFHCDLCSVTCSNRGQLRGHLRTHTGERPFLCQEPGCLKTFVRNEELTRHRRIHSGERPYSCRTCDKTFMRKDHLNKHLRMHSAATGCGGGGGSGNGSGSSE